MIGVLSLGDVASSCGADPCGLWDYISPSAECNTWQTCAATQNASPTVLNPQLNAYGDTVGNIPPVALPCVSGPGPLAPGQSYCTGVLENNTAASIAYFTPAPATAPTSTSIPTWGLAVGGVALLALLMSKKR